MKDERISRILAELDAIQAKFDVMDDATGHLAGSLYERQAELKKELARLRGDREDEANDASGKG